MQRGSGQDKVFEAPAAAVAGAERCGSAALPGAGAGRRRLKSRAAGPVGSAGQPLLSILQHCPKRARASHLLQQALQVIHSQPLRLRRQQGHHPILQRPLRLWLGAHLWEVEGRDGQQLRRLHGRE